jgi:hypothetical protein
MSRPLFDVGRFVVRTVTRVVWATNPIHYAGEAHVCFVLVSNNRPDHRAGGAGAPAHVTIPAAIANAVFDATGVRLRRLPLTAERVKAALAV